VHEPIADDVRDDCSALDIVACNPPRFPSESRSWSLNARRVARAIASLGSEVPTVNWIFAEAEHSFVRVALAHTTARKCEAGDR